VITRRELLAFAAGMVSARVVNARVQSPTASTNADITLRIGEISLELAPRRLVKTLAYNGQVPGPLLKARAGRPLVVDVWNDSNAEEIVHWHGLHIPPEVDGAREEGTPAVPPRGGRRRYEFTAEPAGTRWYHSHGMTGRNLNGTTYSGQFGLFLVEGENPGAYDQEVPIVLHEWDARFTTPSSMDIEFRYYSINGKMLGAGEPVRVRQGQRVLFRFLNASATLTHRLALSGHLLRVVALDGYGVPVVKDLPLVELGPGERVDAIVDTTNPGIWILGEVDADARRAGMGIVIEYSDQTGAPRWVEPTPMTWDYAAFAGPTTVPQPDERSSFIFKMTDNRRRWMLNGKSHPNTDPILVRADRRYRWLFDNQSAEAHPIHLHRHRFELVTVDGRASAGVVKDVVMVPAWKQVEVDVVADHPGLSLFHCHQQFHMDTGFMTMMRYAD